jgi:SAM-dependent methyltransferase
MTRRLTRSEWNKGADVTRLGSRKISEKEVAEHWDENADTWAEHVGRGFDVYREYLNNPFFFRLIGDLKGKKVLDAGCGEGHNTRILARGGAMVTGVDISPRMIVHARESEKRWPLGIRYEVASFTDMGMFEDETFDACVSFMAMMDSPDFDRAVAEVHRVLKHGGDFFFNIIHPCFMTIGFDWLRDSQGNPVKLMVSDYFSKEHYVERWRFGAAGEDDRPPFAIPYFGRTLSDYFNPLADAGFVLKRIQEPRPPASLCRRRPEFKKWRDTGAIFLQINARKG